MRVAVTGGSGLIGSCFVDYMLSTYNDVEILNIDNLSYAALPGSNDWAKTTGRYTFTKKDIRHGRDILQVLAYWRPDIIVHMAAETHVCNSLDYSKRANFIDTNVHGTLNVLEAMRILKIPKMVYVSSDEVMGQVLFGSSYEDDPLAPRNPYAASKASGELLCHSFVESFDLDISISRCTNNYYKNQHHEKFIPRSILRLTQGLPIELNGKGQHVRSWISALDHSRAIDKIFRYGKKGEIYHVTGGEEYSNKEVARMILDAYGKSFAGNIVYNNIRPTDDLRYSIASRNIHQLGYKHQQSFYQDLPDLVAWYRRFFTAFNYYNTKGDYDH